MATEFFRDSDLDSSMSPNVTMSREVQSRKANEKTDMWAYGMTILVSDRRYGDYIVIHPSPKFRFIQEILTGELPYATLREYEIMYRIASYVLPTAPKDIYKRPRVDRRLWELCRWCWAFEPSGRPTTQEVLHRLDQITEVSSV